MNPFDLNSNEHTSGCISVIFRRILCKNVNSSDHFMDECERERDEEKPPPRPNLVARLMGLETMPVHPRTPKESFERSRSTNSIQGWNGFLCREMNWGGKPRISRSFREEPTFLRKESKEFLVLSFTPEATTGSFGKSKGMQGGVERRQMGRENVKFKNFGSLRKEKLCREPRRRANAEGHHKVKKQREEPRISVSAINRVELECSSENSSPVSVLDRHLDVDGENSPISEEDKMPKQEKPRRKLSSSDIKRDNYPSSTRAELIKNTKEEGIESANDERCNRGKKLEKKQQQGVSDAWSKVWQMAEGDSKDSSWDFFREIWRFDDNGKTAEVIGQEILDFILCETVTELSSCFITT